MIDATTQGVVISVRVIPRAATSSVAGTRGDAILVRLNAPPVDGAANDALIELMAEILEVPRRAVSIVSGQRSRTKRVQVMGISVPTASARLKYQP